MNQTQKHKAKPEGGAVEERKAGIRRTRPGRPKEENDLLNEIDEALETNYREFVRSYVQKVGE